MREPRNARRSARVRRGTLCPWIVDRAVEIRTGEASDRFERVPKGNEQEVRPVALRPAEDGDAAVPRGLEVFLEPLSFRYAKYASAFDDWVTPFHVLAIIASPRRGKSPNRQN